MIRIYRVFQILTLQEPEAIISPQEQENSNEEIDEYSSEERVQRKSS